MHLATVNSPLNRPHFVWHSFLLKVSVALALLASQTRQLAIRYNGKKFRRDGAQTAMGSTKKELGVP